MVIVVSMVLGLTFAITEHRSGCPRDALETILESIQTHSSDPEPASGNQIKLVSQTASNANAEPQPVVFTTELELHEFAAELSRSTGVRVELNPNSGPLSTFASGNACRMENAPGLLLLLKSFAPALHRYAPEFLRTKAGLKRVLVCEDLRLSKFQVRGTTDKASGTLFISHTLENDVEPVDDWAKTNEHCVHHEIFHLIEGRFSEHLQSQFDRWEIEKPKTWEYGKHGLDVARSRQTTTEEKYHHFDLDKDGLLDSLSDTDTPPHVLHPQPGVLTLYSKASVREDRAEFFTAVMLSRETLEFAIQASEEDEFVRKKLLILAEILTVVLDENGELTK